MRMSNAQTGARKKKRPTNLSVDAALLAEARALGVNISSVLEDSLRAKLREEQARRWLAENKEAIEALNRDIDKHGVWSERLRRF
jgi:antitoxin CcdA